VAETAAVAATTLILTTSGATAIHHLKFSEVGGKSNGIPSSNPHSNHNFNHHTIGNNNNNSTMIGNNAGPNAAQVCSSPSYSLTRYLITTRLVVEPSVYRSHKSVTQYI